MSAAPLAGTRVVDFSRLFAGPLCTMTLADLGADVVKVEAPGGDDARHFGPPFLGGEGMNFMALNRGKRSVVLDLKNEQGRRAAQALVREADVVVENFRPGVAERLGIGEADLRRENERLIYCSISGFGAAGAVEQRPALDIILQGLSGLMHRQGAGGEPRLLCVTVADTYAAAQAVQGVLAALIARGRDGTGQRVDVSLLGGILTAQAYRIICDPESLELPAWDDTVPYQAFRAGDGRWLVIAVVSDAGWTGLCRALELPELLADERLVGNPGRVAHRDALIPLLQRRFDAEARDEWIARLDAEGVPCAPVQRLEELLADERLLQAGLLAEVDHPAAGRVRTLGLPVALSRTPAAISRAAPRLGEHTEDELRRVGHA